MAPSHLHYQVYGQGPLVLLAFHGFGQDASVFANFSAAFPGYTIYSIDLFFHGRSHWHGPLDGLTQAKWQEILQRFLTDQAIADFGLIGYSMGGRLALVTCQCFPAQVQQLVLMAPDGIRPHAWYRLATRVPALHGMFRYVTAENPNSFHWLVLTMRHWQLLPRTLLKIAETQMSQPALRARVYRTWMLFRQLEPDLVQIAQLLNQRRVPVQIFTGQHDTVVKPTDMRSLIRRLDRGQHTILACGHGQLLKEVLKWLMGNHFPG